MLGENWSFGVAGPGHRWACQHCGDCCRRFRIDLNLEDLSRLENGSCVDYYLDQRFQPHLRSGESCEHHGCMFLYQEDDKHMCSNYGRRPDSCRIYPFSILPVDRAEARGIEINPGDPVEINDESFVLLYDERCPGTDMGEKIDREGIARTCYRSIRSFVRMSTMPTWEVYSKLSRVLGR